MGREGGGDNHIQGQELGAVLTQAVCPLGKLFLPSSTTCGSPVHHRLELAWPLGKHRKKKSGRGLLARGGGGGGGGGWRGSGRGWGGGGGGGGGGGEG